MPTGRDRTPDAETWPSVIRYLPLIFGSSSEEIVEFW
jgi:hypothetical protein